MNIKELAKIVDLSVTTTSRGLNNHKLVAQKTRDFIQQTAKEIGYSPNLAAKTLKSGKTNNIGVTFPISESNSSLSFMTKFISAFSQTLQEKDYSLIINVANDDNSWKKMIINKQVDAVIVLRLKQNDNRISFLQEKNFPFIVFGHPTKKVNYSWLDLDHSSAFYNGVYHLNKLGHTKIACILGPKELELTQQKINGYKKAMTKLKLKFENYYWSNYYKMDEDGGIKGFGAVYARPNKPTAILCGNDNQAFGVIKRAKEYGLKIGKDLSVIGYDDLSLSSYWHPALSTFHQPVDAIARRLAKRIIRQVQTGSSRANQDLWQAHLVKRDSCGIYASTK